MDKKLVADFFDSLAESWDADMIKDEAKINNILDCAGITEGLDILDVACGTGVLVSDYLKRNIANYTGIDISEKMIEIAENKYGKNDIVSFICADAEKFVFNKTFDRIVIYNAFPHFADRNLLFENLSEHLKCGGRITIAHGMGRNALIRHHSGIAKEVSMVLPETDELSEIMKPFFEVDITLSTDEIYIVSGKKK